MLMPNSQRPSLSPELNRIYEGDTLRVLKTWPDAFVHCVVTSPPYWGLRDYGVAGQLGMEQTPEEFVAQLVKVFREVRRVLRPDGTLWLNIGDSYNAAGRKGHGTRAGHKQNSNRASSAKADQNRPTAANLKEKDLVGIPWMLAFALRTDGWYLRSDIIWAKENPMPESVKDRPTRSHEYIFLLTKSKQYYYDAAAIAEPGSLMDTHTTTRKERADEAQKTSPTSQINGIRSDKQRGHSRRHDGFNDRWDAMTKKDQCATMRNKRDVWTINPEPFPEAHFATFPQKLVGPCVLAGAPSGGLVLDPFMGAGTTALVAARFNRRFLGIELNPEYIRMAQQRIYNELSQGKMF